MKVRAHTLWRVPVFCIISSWVSYYLTIYLGGFFFVVQTVGADGVIEGSADPLRSALFSGSLFIIILLVGGLWFFRSMTKAEIAVSATILSAIYITGTLAELYIPGFPLSLSMELAKIYNWTSTLSSLFLKLTNHLSFSVLLPDLAPFLFVPFGRKSVQ